jgi:diguanylate cyclase (GGDEF)-like protein
MELLHPDDRPRALRDREHVLQGEPYQGEYRVLHPDGSATWAALSVHPVTTPEGVTRIIAIRDVQDEVLAKERMEFLLEHDSLTGLPTRVGITRRLLDLLQRPDAHPRSAALYIGLDSLAEVNEALGHSAGDLLLATVASRITAVAGEEWVGRGAGDEFIVLLADVDSGADAAQLAERLRTAIQQPCDVADHQITPTASIGIAVSTPATTAESVIRDAALAMRMAKEGGRNRVAFVDRTMAAEAEHRLAMETAIREGLEAGEFQPWLQPIVGLGSGEVVGHEALARWVRDTGTVEPGEFIPVAARSSLITDLDLAMLDPAVAAIAALPAPAFISLNVTGQTLARTEYADLVIAALERHGVDARRLHLEITETMLLTLSDRVVAQMRTLADLGCRWYVDDFGTGYSSISHLRDLPVTGLKLDMSFTRGIGLGDETSRQLAMALVGLANGLGLDTVAEGVETDAEAAFLRTLGWRHGQGWLYGKAAPLQ